MADAALISTTKHFGDTTAVDDMNLHIDDGEFVVLLGPTGAGKTTTLRLFAGLEKPDLGTVAIGGKDVTTRLPIERDVAFVFQQYSLYPHYSVYDNMAFPLRAPGRRVAEKVIRKRVTEIAEMLRIAHKLDNKSTELSGGEMQRVSIGRALVREPNLFLMDEPLSSLDAKLREDLRVELKRIQKDLGATIVYVTHDQQEAMTLADRIGILENGALVQIDTPRNVYGRPASVYAAQRLGSPAINLLPCNSPGLEDAPSGAAHAGIRPEDVRIDAGDSGLEAEVMAVERLGPDTIALFSADGQEIRALLDPHAAIEEGDKARITLGGTTPVWFDDQGARIGA